MATYLGKLELIESTFDENTLTLVFLYEEFGEIREITLFKNIYDADTKKFKKDPTQAEKFAKNLVEYLQVTEETHETAIGNKFDVWDGVNGYAYIWEPTEYSKFESDDIGQVYQAKIIGVKEYDAKTMIELDIDGKTYVSNINYGRYVERLKKSLPDPQKKEKAITKFEDKFQIPFKDKEKLVGKDVMITVRQNGNFPIWIEIMALPKKKKK